MAQTIVVRLTDDMTDDGTAAEETVSFALDGTSYLIDLSTGNATALRDALAPFLARARVDKTAPRGAKRGRSGGLSPDETRAIREWAAQHDIHLAPRGRIPQDVVRQWRSRPAA